MSGRNRRKNRQSKAAAQSKKAAPAAAILVEEEKLDGPVNLLKEQGNKLYMEGKYPEAIVKYDEAIELFDQHAALFSNRSASLSFVCRFNEALADAERCIQLKPEWPRGYFRKGKALEGMVRYQEAMDAYDQGLQLSADDMPLKKAKSDLQTLMDDWKVVEPEVKTTDNPDNDVFQQMVDWLIAGGAIFPKLYLKYYSPNYRGVHAASRISEEETVLLIPHQFIMTSDLARESDIGRKIIDSGVELRSKHSYLASYLLQEKHKETSIWDPYLNILPKNFRNMPIFFDEQELSYLQGSPTMEKIHERIESLRREYDNLCRAIPEYSQFTHEEFVWARMVVITRIFGLVIKEVKTDGLVPYADMLNHLRPRETKWTYDDNRQGFVISALKNMKRGDQVYDSYGRKCNSRFFVNYGFSIMDNEDNEYAITLQLDKRDKLYAMKLTMLGDITKMIREFSVKATLKDKKTQEMLSFLRFIHTQDSELMFLQNSDDGSGVKIEQIDAISLRNEEASLITLKRTCEDYLSRFPDSLERDLELLQDQSLTSNVRNAIIMRKGEKEILHFFIRMADEMLPLLHMQWKDLKRHAAKNFHSNGPYDSYVSTVITRLVKNSS